jgi:hypothetical protein
MDEKMAAGERRDFSKRRCNLVEWARSAGLWVRRRG